MSLINFLKFFKAFQNFIPLFSTLIACIIASVPISPAGSAILAPMLGPAAAFYWSLYRFDIFSYWSAFIIGFFSDILYGTPLGSGPLLFLALREIASRLSQHLKDTAFIFSWVTVSVSLFLYSSFAWLFSSLYYWSYASFIPSIFQLILTIFLYPALYILLGFLANFISNNEEVV